MGWHGRASGCARAVEGLTAAVDRLGDRAVDERGHDGHLDQPTTHADEVLDALTFPVWTMDSVIEGLPVARDLVTLLDPRK